MDIALIKGRFTASRTVWGTADLRHIVVTRADPATIGLSTIAALVRHTGPVETVGVALDLDPVRGQRMRAPITPGLIAEVGIRSMRVLRIGESVEWVASGPLVIALDREREIAIREGSQISVSLRADGPWLIDAVQAVRQMARQGFFAQSGWP